MTFTNYNTFNNLDRSYHKINMMYWWPSAWKGFQRCSLRARLEKPQNYVRDLKGHVCETVLSSFAYQQDDILTASTLIYIRQ